MFKKLNQLYKTVFGNENGNNKVPCGYNDYETLRPLVDEVRTLKHQVKKQGQIIDSLLNHLGLEYDYDYSSLSGEETFTIEKKTNKK